jgi:flagellar hook-associated protein 2
MPSPTVFGLSGSKINWEEMVKKVMKAYEKRLKIFKLGEWETKHQIAAWKVLRKKLQNLRDAAKFLYDPTRGPFSSLQAESSDQRAFSATTARIATPGKYKINVLQTASSDIFQSDSVSQTKKLPAASFTVKSGKHKFKINFTGGTIHTLESVINRVADKILKASVMNIDDENVALIITGKNPGLKNKIFISTDDNMLFDIGLIQRKGKSILKVDFSSAANFRKKNGDVTFSGGIMKLASGASAEKVADNDIFITDNLFLDFTARLTSSGESRASANTASRGQNAVTPHVNIGTIDNLRVGPYSVRGQRLIDRLSGGENIAPPAPLPAPVTPVAGNDCNISLNLGSTVVKKIKINTSEQFSAIRISLNDIKGKTFDRIVFVNNSTGKIFEIKNLKISGGKEQILPKNHVTKAANAIIKYNGIKITRQTNAINKLIPGVTLNISRRTNGDENLSIDYNYKDIAKAVEDFVTLYNNAMDFIYNTTKFGQRKNLKQRLAYMDKLETMDEQKKKALTQSGELFESTLAGDMTVSIIKRKLRSAMMNPYPTSAGVDVRFFIQIGLKNPSFSADATDEQKKNMRAGYFLFEKKKFIEMMKKNYLAVKEFFAHDTNGDLVKDNGLSFNLNKTLQYISAKSYRADNGRAYPSIIENKLTVAMSFLKNRQKSTKSFERQMENKRQRLINQIRRAEQAEARANSIRQRLNSFGSGGGQR